jgi:hypothetical protein
VVIDELTEMATNLLRMSGPGWYPDPSGQPKAFRYWDGRSWSHETSPSPYVAPPGWQPTPQPGPHGGPAPSKGSGTKVALILLAVVLIAGAAVAGFFGVRALTDDSSARGETSESSPSESDSPSPSETETDDASTEPPQAITAACTGAAPEGGNRPGAMLRGGGLTVELPDGFEPMEQEAAFTFADEVVTVARQIEEGWIAVYALGGVPTSAGFSGPDQAAETVLTCMAASATFYRNLESRTDLASEPITVEGYDGWRITSELRIDDPEIDQEGDHATVIVVETDSPDEYGLFVSVVPLGDQQLVDQQESVVETLQVSGAPA